MGEGETMDIVTRIHEAAVEPPSETRMIQVVMPEMLNHQGTLFGGQALAMMDTAGFVAATRHCRRTTVTVKVNEVDYLAPVSQGQIIEIVARVVATGRTSMTVAVSMVAEELGSGVRTLAGRGQFVFVALEDGVPTPVPPLA